MRTRAGRMVFYAFVAVLVFAIAGAIGYMVRAGGGALPVTGQASDFTATNLDGKPVRFSSLDGKIRLVTFFYTHCPGPCPLTAYRLEQVQNDLKQQGLFGTQVAIVSVTLDPEHDTLQVIKDWSSHYQPDYGGWYFLRPDPQQLPAILKAWGIYKQQVPNSVYISHTLVTELIDQNGNIRATYLGDNPDPKKMEQDIHSLIARWHWL
ncbi:SCO family protein [Alicyclobacillus macrosporangiidus]|nr:SCO family protein [Alicyclobacillus macrosporangiidus]